MYIATISPYNPPVCSHPLFASVCADRRLNTAPNPLSLREPLERTWLLAILDGCLAACLAHPLRPLARAPPLRGKGLFPSRYPIFALRKRGPARTDFRFAHLKTPLPRRAGGEGLCPQNLTRAWARCIAAAQLRFRLPQSMRCWTQLTKQSAL